MYRMYAADPRARINLGIRRRLAPLMENDIDRIKLMNSLLLSMPGSPIVYYGDEIGMGDNIFLGDRNGVRTPMQWSPDRNAGFSRADPQRLYLPPIMDPVYGYEAVNVEAQARDPRSLLNWMRRMLAVRKTSHAFGRGRLAFLRPGNRKVLAYLRELRRRGHPVRGQPGALRAAGGARPHALQGPRAGRAARPHAVPADRRAALPAHAAGARLLLVPPRHRRPRCRAGTRSGCAREDLPVLVLFDGWTSFFRDRVVPWRIGMAREDARSSSRPRCCRASSSRSAGTPPRARRSKRAGSSTSRSGSVRRRQLAARRCRARGRGRARDATSCRSRSPGRTGTRSGCRRSRPSRSRRCASRRTSACWAMRSPTRRSAARSSRRSARGASWPPRTARCASRPTAAFARTRRATLAALPVGTPHAQSSNTVVTHRRAAVPQGLPPAAARHQPGARNRPLPDRGGAFPSIACRSPARRARRRADGTPTTLALLQAYVRTRATAGPTRSTISSAIFEDAAHRAPTRRRRRARRLSRARSRRSACAPPSCTARFARATGDPAFEPEPLTGRRRRSLEQARVATTGARRSSSSSSAAPSCPRAVRDEAQAAARRA